MDLRKKIIVEIGCGLGVVTNILNEGISNSIVSGVDISKTAVDKASLRYQNIDFHVGDIASKSFRFHQRVDVVILNQMLWYVLEDLNVAIDNVYNALNRGGYLVISMAFLKDQKYGNNIIYGFDGLIDFCDDLCRNNKFTLIFSDLDKSGTFEYSDGIVCLKKI